MNLLLTAHGKENIPHKVLFKDFHLLNEICILRLKINEIHLLLSMLCISHIFQWFEGLVDKCNQCVQADVTFKGT